MEDLERVYFARPTAHCVGHRLDVVIVAKNTLEFEKLQDYTMLGSKAEEAKTGWPNS